MDETKFALSGCLTLASAIALSSSLILAIALFLAAIVLLVPNRHLADPNLPLYLIIFATVANLSDILIATYGLPSTSKLFAAVLFAAAALKIIGEGERPQLYVSGLIFILAFATSAGLSTLFAQDDEVSEVIFMDLLKNIILAVIVMLFTTEFAVMRRSALAIVAALFLLGAVGMAQVLTGEYTDDFFGFGGVTLAHIAGETDGYRLVGPFSDPNSFARILVIALPLACYFIFYAANALQRLFATAALVAISFTLFFTYSRGAMIAVAVMLVPAFWSHRDKWRILLPFGLAALVLVPALFPGNFLSRFDAITPLLFDDDGAPQSTDQSIANRLDEMRLALVMFADNIFLGSGLGNYKALFQFYAINETGLLRHEDREAHSRILEVAAEQGLVGLVTYLAVIYIALRNAVTALSHPLLVSNRDKHLVLALTLGFVGYLTASIFLHDDYARIFWTVIGMLFAVPVCIKKAQVAGNVEAREAPTGDRNQNLATGTTHVGPAGAPA